MEGSLGFMGETTLQDAELELAGTRDQAQMQVYRGLLSDSIL